MVASRLVVPLMSGSFVHGEPAQEQTAWPSAASPARCQWVRLQPDGSQFLASCLVLIVATIGCFTPPQSDTWWHLRAGLEMVRSGHVMLTDQFSHTAYGRFWPNHEWLSQVVFYGLHSLGGMPLLTAVCGLSCFLSWLVSFNLTRGRVDDCVLVAALGLPGVLTGWALRPQAFTFLLLMVVLLLVLRGRSWWLPPLFVVWANLHGAVALGFVVLVADLVVDAFWGQRRWARKVTVIGACFGATFITPLGFGYWGEIAGILHRSQVNVIFEWTAPTLTVQYAFFWVLAAVFAWLTVTRWKSLSRRDDRVMVVTSALLLGLAIRAMRNIGPFALIAAPAMTRLLWTDRPVVRVQPQTADRLTKLRVWVFACAFAGAVSVVLVGWLWITPTAWTPISKDAAAAVRACPERLFNYYNDGGYLIWFVPERLVFLDSRQDPYPPEVMRAHDEAEAKRDYRPLFAQYGIGCAVVRPWSGAADILARHTAPLYQDAHWAVFDVTAGAAGMTTPARFISEDAR